MMSPTVEEFTLYTWGSGLFPRRVRFYLAEKQLPPYIHIKEVHSVPTGSGLSQPEGKPSGSVPILHIHATNTYIGQSTAIMEYFEDRFPGRDGFNDLTGKTPEIRAKTRDVLELATEACFWTGSMMMFDSNLFSGLGITPSIEVAEVFKQRGKPRYQQLEDWCKESGVGEDGVWLNGTKEISTADCGMASQVQFISELYQLDTTKEYEHLSKWYQQWLQRPAANNPYPLDDGMRQLGAQNSYHNM